MSDHDAPHHKHRREHPRLERLEEAAIAAEFETGVREETVAEAKQHILIRLGRISFGALVTVLGVLLIPLPGPGLVVVAVGLGILAQDVPFAKRLLDQVRDRLPEDENGDIPKWMIATMVLSVLAATSGSLYFALLR